MQTCDWSCGQVIAYQLTSKRKVLFLVVALEADRGGTHPICGLLDFVGAELPDVSRIQELPLKECVRAGNRPPYVFSNGRLSQREYPSARVIPLQVFVKFPKKICEFTICTWRYLDELLKRDYGLE